MSGGCQKKAAETAFQQKMFASFLRGAGYLHETLKLAGKACGGY